MTPTTPPQVCIWYSDLQSNLDHHSLGVGGYPARTDWVQEGPLPV